MFFQRLKEAGFKPIVSEKQAIQLLRRELKFRRSQQQRHPNMVWNYDDLLAIKRGNWFRFVTYKGCCSITIWPVTDYQKGNAAGGEG